MYDPEAVIQEADILMAQYAEEARAGERARAAGLCTHNSWVGASRSGEIFYPEQEGLKPGEVVCTDGCGRKFASDEDRYHSGETARWNGEYI